jgi:anti-anti-sigma factor
MARSRPTDPAPVPIEDQDRYPGQVQTRPFATAFSNDTRTLVVSGEVDELSGQALRSQIVQCSENFTQPLSIDLSDVDFFPSLGVGILARAMTMGEIELVAEDGCVAQRVLRICQLPYREP